MENLSHSELYRFYTHQNPYGKKNLSKRELIEAIEEEFSFSDVKSFLFEEYLWFFKPQVEYLQTLSEEEKKLMVLYTTEFYEEFNKKKRRTDKETISSFKTFQ